MNIRQLVNILLEPNFNHATASREVRLACERALNDQAKLKEIQYHVERMKDLRFERIENLSILHKQNLVRILLNDAGLKKIQINYPDAETVNIFLKFLIKNSVVESLELYRQINNVGAKLLSTYLNKSNSLKALRLAYEISELCYSDIIQGINSSQSLSEIEFQHSVVTGPFAEILSRDLKSNSQIKKIKFVSDELNPHAMTQLRLALSRLDSLTHFVFEDVWGDDYQSPHGSLEDKITAEEVIKILASMIGDFSKLESLELKLNHSHADYKPVADAVNNHSNKDNLKCDLKGAGCFTALKYLLHHKSITTVNMSNSRPSASLSLLVQGVIGNCYITHMDLSNCTLGRNAGFLLGFMLAHSYCVESLILDDNQLDDIEIASLAKGLSRNTSLRNLSLNTNEYTFLSCIEIMKAAQTHPRLSSIYFRSFNSQIRALHDEQLLISQMDLLRSNSVLDAIDRMIKSKEVSAALSSNSNLQERFQQLVESWLKSGSLNTNKFMSFVELLKSSNKTPGSLILKTSSGLKAIEALPQPFQSNIKSVNALGDKVALRFSESFVPELEEYANEVKQRKKRSYTS